MMILLVQSYTEGLKKAWKSSGYEVCEAGLEKPEEIPTGILAQKFKEMTRGRIPEIVFSYDFVPRVSDLCEEWGCLYFSWIVDAPHIALYTASVRNRVNRIFAFDYAQCVQLKKRGVESVYYLPLCVDVESFDETIRVDRSRGRLRYGSDVSFVGGLYDNPRHSMYDQIGFLPDYTRGYLEALMCAQRRVWGENLVRNCIPREIWAQISRHVHVDLSDFPEGYIEPGYYEAFLETALFFKIAQMERKELCSGLAKRFAFALYSGSDTSYDPGIQNKGWANYRTEMPLIFAYSKININLTLHGIETGIPLRVMDILACGGFCMTNYQAELAEFFTIGEELVVYEDFEDLYAKAAYYLAHEEERREIAEHGNRRVRELFDAGTGVETMLKYAGVA